MRVYVFLFLALFTFAFPANAQQEQSGESVSLIADADLSGWRGDLDSWKVIDGTLIGRADGSLKANRFIVADIDPVKNFEMHVDVWISEGGNSGLQYRSQERPDLGPAVVTGYQCDVVSNKAEYNGMLYEERGRRILRTPAKKW